MFFEQTHDNVQLNSIRRPRPRVNPGHGTWDSADGASGGGSIDGRGAMARVSELHVAA
jgi:hypothetical protein